MTLTLTIENFKSVGLTTLVLKPGLNILIGPNGSGKTCIMSSLTFLRDTFRFGAARAMAYQGGSKIVYHRGAANLRFVLKADYGARIVSRRKRPTTVEWSIEIAPSGAENLATVIAERLVITAPSYRQTVLFDAQLERANGKTKVRAYLTDPDTFGRDLFTTWGGQVGVAKPTLRTSLVKQLNAEIKQILRAEPDRPFVPLVAGLDNRLRRIYSYISGVHEYNIHPAAARASTDQLSFARMEADGSGVAEVIDALAKRLYHKIELGEARDLEGDPIGPWYGYYRRPIYRYSPSFYVRNRPPRHYADTLERINQELSAAASPIASVKVRIDESTGRRFIDFVTDNEDVFRPEQVSDGTIKWLCILVSLFVPFSSLYLVEEPENFLHPWMQQRLLTLMRSDTEKDPPRIFLLSTHSATLLNAAKAQEIMVVTNGLNGTDVETLTGREDISEALRKSDFHLGDLWIGGLLGGIPGDEG